MGVSRLRLYTKYIVSFFIFQTYVTFKLYTFLIIKWLGSSLESTPSQSLNFVMCTNLFSDVLIQCMRMARMLRVTTSGFEISRLTHESAPESGATRTIRDTALMGVSGRARRCDIWHTPRNRTACSPNTVQHARTGWQSGANSPDPQRRTTTG